MGGKRVCDEKGGEERRGEGNTKGRWVGRDVPGVPVRSERTTRLAKERRAVPYGDSSSHSSGRQGKGLSRALTYSPPSSTPLTSSTVDRSARNPSRSESSESCGSLNHVEIGTAFEGWNE